MTQRRLLTVADIARSAAVYAVGASHTLGAKLNVAVVDAQKATSDLERRVNALLEDHLTEVKIELARIIDARRNWVFSQGVDDGKAVQKAWAHLHSELVAEMDALLVGHRAALLDSLDECAASFRADWSVPLADFRESDVQFDGMLSAWMHTGVKVAGAAAVALWGTEIGAAIGSVVPGPGTLIGAGVGFVAGAAIGWFANTGIGWVAGRFKNRDGHLRERRSRLAGHVNENLDGLANAMFEAYAQQVVHQCRKQFEANQTTVRQGLSDQAELVRRLDSVSDQFAAEVRRLDRSATAALLRLVGYGQSAASVIKAVRAPGVAAACTLGSLASADELTLFPPDTVERIIPLADFSEFRAAGHVAASLGEVVRLEPRPSELRVEIRTHAPLGRLKVMAELATKAAGSPVRLTSSATGGS
jgi:hypothetical protein